MKKKILVTGGAGYIGSSLSNYLLDKNYDVTIVDNLIVGKKINIPKKANFFEVDISNKKKMLEILKIKYDCIVHLAAFTNVTDAIKFPNKFKKNNYEKSKIFLDLCIKTNQSNIIFSSTAAVYKSSNVPIVENAPLKPMNAYSKYKLEIEKYLKILHKSEKINVVIFRYFNVIGADAKLRSGMIDKKSKNLIKKLCNSEIYNSKFIRFGKNLPTEDGSPVRDLIDIRELTNIHQKFINLLIKKKKNFIYDIFNCGTGRGISVKKIVNTFLNISKKKFSYKIEELNKGEIVSSVCNNSKIKKKLKWKPRFLNLEESLKYSLLWEKKIKKKNI